MAGFQTGVEGKMIARALRYCTRLFCTWHCVAVFEVRSNHTNPHKAAIVFYYLFENRFYERKITLKASGHKFASYDKSWEHMNTAKETWFYRQRILPWLLGRIDREVPSFRNATTGKEEFLKQLKGLGQNIVVEIND